MSMVLFASVVRVRDGLPLSASTDYEQDKAVQESKRHLKSLSKKLGHFPDRCTLRIGQHTINFTSSLGVGYLMVCTESYPSVLAFCFLDELQMEFIVSYDTNKINGAVRPYSFIEFDHFIQKIKLRYNSPRSLTTKINLADMQTEIKLRPPYQLSTSDIGTLNGFANFSPNKYKGIAPNQMLEPVTLAGVISCMLSLLCGALNLIRGVHAIESVLQCYLLTFCTGWRSLKAAMSFALICLCNLYLYELRNSWQLFFHVTVGAFATLQIRLRQPQGKAPDYNV
ncbi:SC22A protein, partial [Polypterus senegalus]